MKRRLNRKWTILIVLITAAGLWWMFGTNKDAKPKGPPSPLVRIAAVQRKDMPLEIHEVGNVVANESVAIRSRLDSEIVEVKFRDGHKVKKGDLLFVLDDRNLKAQAAQLAANVKRDQAQLENLRQQYQRDKALTAKGYESEANLENSQAAYEAQRAIVGSAQAALEALNVQLGYTRIVSPIDGRTGTINITAGNTVKANDTQPLVTINQIQPIRVQAALSQSYFNALRDAQGKNPVEALAQREGVEGVSNGSLEYIDNAVNQSTGTFITRSLYPNQDESLWPGMYVQQTLKLGVELQALVVPEVAVQHGQQNDYVFVIADKKAQQRPVKIARQQDGVAIITEGLQDGEFVAVDGMMGLKNDVAVTVKDDSQPSAATDTKSP